MGDQHFRHGQELKADDINDIVDHLLQQITGGKNIQVRTFGDRLVVSRTRKVTKGPAPAAEVPVKILTVTPYSLWADEELSGSSGQLFIGTSSPCRIYRYSGTGDVDTGDYETLAGDTVHDIIRSSMTGHLYACTGEAIGGGLYGRIFVSEDDGDSWSLCEKTDTSPMLDTYPLVAFVRGSNYVYCINKDNGTAPVTYKLEVSGRWSTLPVSYADSIDATGIGRDDQYPDYLIATGPNGSFNYDPSGGGVWGNVQSAIKGHSKIVPFDNPATGYGKNYYGALNTAPEPDTVGVAQNGNAGLNASVVFTIETADVSVRMAKIADDDWIFAAFGVSGEGTRVYRSLNGTSFSRVDEDYDEWGGDDSEIKAAEHFSERLYVGSDGLWKCPTAWGDPL